jgi:phosphoribosyl 1,2-cyclic phosphate phosphodiesterase
MRVTVLGCGSSTGVPMPGNEWGACDPANPRNRRRRASILVETGTTAVLVDTSPDLREQLIDARCKWLDAVIYTHGHADHLHGIDDIRSINYFRDGPLDAYADDATLDVIRARFGYVFDPIPAGMEMYKPWLIPHRIAGPFRIGDLDVVPFDQDHGFSRTLGFRFGPIAYSTDVVNLPEEAFAALAGVETWIVDCLQEAPHRTHTHLARTLEWIARVKPRRAVLTHMNVRVDYATLVAKLPAGVEPAWDGMVLT